MNGTNNIVNSMHRTICIFLRLPNDVIEPMLAAVCTLERERGRERDRDRAREIERDRESEIERDRERERERERDRDRARQREGDRGRE